ncbi:MAG: thioesterase family protein [Myxococcales bacterium]
MEDTGSIPPKASREDELIRRSQFVFFHPLRVRWAELDPQGIVFNPNYFMYFDVAFSEYMRAIGYAYPGGLSTAGCDLFAVSANATFRASARYDDELQVAVRVARIGRTSLTAELAVYRGEELLVIGSLVYVTASLESRNPVPVPSAFVDAIAAFEQRAPTQR